MTAEDIRIIEREMDAIMEKFNRGHFDGQEYHNYSKTVRNAIYNNQFLHRKTRECQVAGCTQKSIARSHSIPKTSVLENISSNGHLYTPEFDGSTGTPQIYMKRVGLSNASVFPGFCIKHENLFSGFEADGKINSVKDGLLQTYRTICKERVEIEIKLQINKIAADTYKNAINKEAANLWENAFKVNPNQIGIEKFSVDGIDHVLDKLNRYAAVISQPLSQLQKFENSIYSWLLDSSADCDLQIHIVGIDFHVPVAICGFGSYGRLVGGQYKAEYLLMNVLPKKEAADIICVALEESDPIDEFLEYSFSNPVNILNMLESFMVNGSDQWYVTPEYWDNICNEKRDKILQDVLLADDSFLNEYKISIFDDIRKKMLLILEENIRKERRNIPKDEQKRIDKEYTKLNSKDFDLIEDIQILTGIIQKKFNRSEQSTEK